MGSDTRPLTALVRRTLASRALPAVAALCTVALVSPSLRTGWILDDIWHRAGHTRAEALRPYLGDGGVFGSAMRMYAFWDGVPEHTRRLMDRGVVPWWTNQSLRISFWRPIASLTHGVEYRLWPERSEWMHAQSLLWLGLVVVLAGAWFRRLFDNEWPAGFATLVFAFSECHALPAAWLANRHVLVAMTLGFAALLLDGLWRARRHVAWLASAVLAFSGALLASEAGIATLAFVTARAVLLDTGGRMRRLASLAPYVAVGVSWRLGYTQLGFGVTASAFYVDPGTEPIRFAAATLERLPILALSLLGVPADIYMLLSASAARLYATGAILALVVLAALTRALWSGCRRCAFWGLGLLLALVPLCAGMPGGRNLGFAALGMAGLVTCLTERAARAPSLALSGVVARRLALAALTAILVSRLLMAPAALCGTAALSVRLGPGLARVLDVSAADGHGPYRYLILANPPASLGLFFLVPDRIQRGLPAPEHVRLLAPGGAPVAIERTGERSILVRPQDGYCAPPRGVGLVNVIRNAERFLCDARRPLRLGDTIDLTDVRIRVTASTPDGRAGEAAFQFAEPLESPALRWLRWDAGRAAYAELTLPPVGGRLLLE
jgi:hypothetical protein